ncbi:RecX family transcriptional regulator [candidate division KSB1 bacterium]|nr:RecX family transcriptional regulator [candidate division KSB1 bacterium]
MDHKRKITAIEPQKRNKKRCSIFLDGEYAFGLDEELVLKYHLHEGDLIDEDEFFRLIQDDLKKIARDRSFRILGYRARSENELRDKLFATGLDEETIDWTIEDLKTKKILSDDQFVLAFIHDKMLTHPIGPLAIKQELKLKGISDDLIEFAIEEAFREKSQYEVASELIKKRQPFVKNENRLKARKKLADFLYRRGFGWEIIGAVLEHQASEWPDDGIVE